MPEATARSPESGRRGRLLGWFTLALLVLLLDQWSKALATAQLDYARPVEIFWFLNMTLHHNSGAAFSFLSDSGGWQRWFFTAVAVVACTVLSVWLSRLRREEWLLALSLALILGGAAGNLYDRVMLGYVVDFISAHYENSYFPTFNIADSAISVGAALMILDTLLDSGRRGRS